MTTLKQMRYDELLRIFPISLLKIACGLISVTRCAFFSNNFNWVPLRRNRAGWSGLKCYWLFRIKARSSVGAFLVLNCCQYVYHRDELQPHAQLCRILPSMTY